MKIAGFFYKPNEYNFTTEPHTTIEKSRTSMIKQRNDNKMGRTCVVFVYISIWNFVYQYYIYSLKR
jgi:hypothetical protein